MSIVSLIAFVGLATIQGALVALPSPLALGGLARLRSPAWALLAPGSLLVGTFGVLAMPSLATGLAILAAAATPALAAIAVLGVVHGRRRALLLVPVALGVVTLAESGLPAEVAASLLTALGCLTLGAAIVRLTPRRWLSAGLVAMATIDVILLAAGIGQPAAMRLADASAGVAPVLHRAQLGPMSIDYPDLVLAAVLGGVVAGRAVQARAAALVAILATANGALFAFADIVPATMPGVLALIMIECRQAIGASYRAIGRRACSRSGMRHRGRREDAVRLSPSREAGGRPHFSPRDRSLSRPRPIPPGPGGDPASAPSRPLP